jgi:hypothetical protein
MISPCFSAVKDASSREQSREGPVFYLQPGLSALWLHPPMGNREQQPYAVLLVCIRYSGIIVDSHDVGMGKKLLNGLEHTLCGNMVGQACQGLHAYYIIYSPVQIFPHFCSNQPAFSRMVAQ